ncbi:MAG: AAA family ATPase [Candidatus Heimdallarchaeota archaeon]|nr:AAA family ATPase [Candidatus Heimdallarchaeota archaeon]
MIFWDSDSNLLATGLPLKAVSKLLATSSTDSELQQSLEKLGTKYLARYLIMKEYRTLVENGLQKLPIIPIIVGIPGAGKTTIAKELSTALNIGLVIGGDVLRSSLRSIITTENEIFHSSIYDTWKFFGKYSSKNLISGYKAQADIMNSIIQKMIADRGLRDGESMIVEYLHFLPTQFNSDLLKHPSLIPVILQITEKELYKERIKLRSKYSHLRNSGERLISEVDKYLQMQEYLCSEAIKFKIPVVSVNDFVEGYETILDIVLGRIKKLNELKDYTDRINLVEEIKKERKA